MSHFMVLVVTATPSKEELEGALLPYHEYECTGIKEYLQFVPVDVDELQADYEKHGAGCDPEEFIKNWYGESYFQQDGVWGRMTNPNSKWDWWSIGGRYSGRLRIKGKSGEFNRACKGDLDLDHMERDRRVMRFETWESYEADKAKNPNYPLEHIYGIKAGTTRERYLNTDPGFTSFAVLVNGQWHERGDMGWWGIVSDEKEDWTDQFKRLFDDIPDDAWLTVVDCHI